MCKLDAKDYGLPQTRNRKYLFGYRIDDERLQEDEDGERNCERYEEALRLLKTPEPLFSFYDFTLKAHNPAICRLRDALRGPQGEIAERWFFIDDDFANCMDRDVPPD